jgi:AmiR/NasT family two-component response regulator
VSAPTAARSLERELRAAQERVEQLERALTSRIVVDLAVGVLLERHALDRDEAFELLRRAARHHRRRIHDLAAEVVADRAERPEIGVVLALRADSSTPA